MLRLCRRAAQTCRSSSSHIFSSHQDIASPTISQWLSTSVHPPASKPIMMLSSPEAPTEPIGPPDDERIDNKTNMDDEYGKMDDSGETFRVENFELECGVTLKQAQVRYRKFGEFNEKKDNCLVVCHALTGNAAVDSWWSDIFGPGRMLDPSKYLIVCANVLGSCYGSTGPVAENPETGKPYGNKFPDTTIRDTVRLHHRLVKQGLGATSIACVVGGSLGGMQTLEWAAICGPEYVRSIIPICCGAYHRAWQIGISETQRQAIYADPKWQGGAYEKKPGHEPDHGLSVARQIAMITYRSHEAYNEKFGRKQVTGLEEEKLTERDGQRVHWDVERYLRYQGYKFLSRFDALSYVKVTRMMDSHDVGRGRGGVEAALAKMTMPALIVAVSSDALYPPSEQRELHRMLPHSEFLLVESPNGHDGFLLDHDKISPVALKFLAKYASSPPHTKKKEKGADGTKSKL
eukprot:gb/GEZN01002447.1/.p1 GENE.gb/GEZN01002447.1/~~gb/GEZN01002447.1/.p1  ORF type:complete len:461 (-),score=76.50 gb/GEZN01002447.1/:1034-2416(-)